MRLLLLILISSAINISAKTKTIIVKTDKAINLKKLKIYTIPTDNIDWASYVYNIDKKTISFSIDTNQFYIEYANSITYKFENIQKIIADTIIINEVKLFKYRTADTIYTIVTKFNRDSTISSTKSKTEIVKNKNLDLYIPYEILINNKPISSERIIEHDGMTSYYCTPYKIAYSDTWTGRRITFVYKL